MLSFPTLSFITMSFKRKVVVVTGASAGIGEAIAIVFAKEGADLALVGRNEERLQKVANQCNKNGKNALIIKSDFTKEDDARTVIPKVIERFGKIDVLVNNAGTFIPGKILDGSLLKGYSEVMMVNLTVPVILTCEAAPHLAKTKGSIVNISSCAAYDEVSYSMSKSGLDNFTRCAALELGSSGVRVNSVNPGAVRTNVISSFENSEAIVESMVARSVLKKMAEPEEIAEMTLFLASTKARNITGENYIIDNGVNLIAASMQ